MRKSCLFLIAGLFFTTNAVVAKSTECGYHKHTCSVIERANKGDAEAQNTLAGYYYVPLELEQDYNEALKWFKKSAEDIAKTIGNQTQTRTSTSKSTKGIINQNTSENQSNEGQYLLTAQDILNLNSDECIILGQGQLMHPIIAKCAFWFKK